MHDTIIAPATPGGQSAIGIVRISGDKALDLTCGMFSNVNLSKNRKKGIYHGSFRRHGSGEIIDEPLVMFFPGPNSYTGEDVIEISCHGNPLIIKDIIDSYISAGAAIAEPGEFTLRAYLNGRMDLTQAEAVNDIIRARTGLARASALNQMMGGFLKSVSIINNDILNLLSEIEAAIDHSDTDEVFISREKIESSIEQIKIKINKLLGSSDSGRIMREGMRIAITGAPNTGKSSLMNSLLRKDRCIVSDLPGTTRDSIEDELNVMGIPARIVDTAGIRETDDPVEQLGISRSIESLNNCDINIMVFDASRDIMNADTRILSLLPENNIIYVLNKTDIPQVTTGKMLNEKLGIDTIEISALTSEGIELIEQAIYNFYFSLGYDPRTDTIVTNIRHVNLLKNAFEYLDRARSDALKGQYEDILASNIRKARNMIEEISGKTGDDAVLDRIFSQFCIGK